MSERRSSYLTNNNNGAKKFINYAIEAPHTFKSTMILKSGKLDSDSSLPPDEKLKIRKSLIFSYFNKQRKPTGASLSRLAQSKISLNLLRDSQNENLSQTPLHNDYNNSQSTILESPPKKSKQLNHKKKRLNINESLEENKEEQSKYFVQKESNHHKKISCENIKLKTSLTERNNLQKTFSIQECLGIGIGQKDHLKVKQFSCKDTQISQENKQLKNNFNLTLSNNQAKSFAKANQSKGMRKMSQEETDITGFQSINLDNQSEFDNEIILLKDEYDIQQENTQSCFLSQYNWNKLQSKSTTMSLNLMKSQSSQFPSKNSTQYQSTIFLKTDGLNDQKQKTLTPNNQRYFVQTDRFLYRPQTQQNYDRSKTQSILSYQIKKFGTIPDSSPQDHFSTPQKFSGRSSQLSQQWNSSSQQIFKRRESQFIRSSQERNKSILNSCSQIGDQKDQNEDLNKIEKLITEADQEYEVVKRENKKFDPESDYQSTSMNRPSFSKRSQSQDEGMTGAKKSESYSKREQRAFDSTNISGKTREAMKMKIQMMKEEDDYAILTGDLVEYLEQIGENADMVKDINQDLRAGTQIRTYKNSSDQKQFLQYHSKNTEFLKKRLNKGKLKQKTFLQSQERIISKFVNKVDFVSFL